MINPPSDPLAAALELIGQGIPVFPCNPSSKAPLLSHDSGGRGHLDATTDAGQVRQWWERFGGRVLWGVPTGRRTGIAVLDIDRGEGVDGVETLRKQGISTPKTRCHLTPRGGLHLIYRLGEGETCPTDAGRLGPGLDRRGDGGYVIWYPAHGGSVVESFEPQPAPSFLTLPVRSGKDAIRVVSDDQAQAIASDLLAEARGMVEGERNATLSRCAFIIGQLIHAGFFSDHADTWRDELIRIGQQCGMDSGEPERVVTKAFTRASENPGFESVDTAVFRAFGDPVQWTPRGMFDDALDIAERPSAPKWLIRGVMEQNVNALLHGQPNAGKSFLLVDWCLSIACGLDWTEHKVTEGPVVYLLGEGHSGFRRRLAAWMLDRGVRPRRGWFRLLRRAVALNNAPDLESVCAEIDGGPRPVLIIIDTKMRFTPGWDENAPVDTGRYVALVGGLMARYGCAVLTVHHTGKSSGTAMGHNSLRGAVDNEWTVVGCGEAPHWGFDWKVTKLKDGEAVPPKRFKFDSVDLSYFDEEGERVRSAVVRPVKVEAGSDGVVIGGGAGQGDTVGDGPKRAGRKFSRGDRLMLQALGFVDEATVNDTPRERANVMAVFFQVHGGTNKRDVGRVWDAAYARALERQWFEDNAEVLKPQVLAIRRDIGLIREGG